MAFRACKWFFVGWSVWACLLAAVAVAGEKVAVTGEKVAVGGEKKQEGESLEALQSRFERTDTVSVVKVKYIGELINPALSSSGMVVVEGYTYSGQVMRSWKGPQQSHFKLRVDLSHCSSRLSMGGEYVVFSQRMDHNRLQSFRCEDMVPREEAADLILALDKVSELHLAKRAKGDNPSI